MENDRQYALSGILLFFIGLFITFYPWLQLEDDWDTFVSMYDLMVACGGLGKIFVGGNDCGISKTMFPVGVGLTILGLISGGISVSLSLNKENNESKSSKKLSMSQLTGNSEKDIFNDFYEVVGNLLDSVPDSEIDNADIQAAKEIHRKIVDLMPNPNVETKINYFTSINQAFSSMPDEWIKLFSQSAEYDSYKKMGDWVEDIKSSDSL
jgi:hypothetical protein